MERPKADLKWSLGDKVLITLSWLLVAGAWVFSIFHFAELPDEIPMHFNAKGIADSFGDKRTLFLTPLMATGLWVFLWWLAKRPHILNYAVAIIPENYQRQYILASRLLLWLGLLVVVLFGFITFDNVRIAHNQTDSLNAFFLPTIFISFLLILIIYLMASNKK